MPGEISRQYDPFPYDPKAYELAEHYLQDEPCRRDAALYKDHCISLAQHIQRAVEAWFMLSPNT
jgi:hypothetical protein